MDIVFTFCVYIPLWVSGQELAALQSEVNEVSDTQREEMTSPSLTTLPLLSDNFSNYGQQSTRKNLVEEIN